MDYFLDPGIAAKRELANGEKIPCMGMGTFGADCFTFEQIANAVAGAIRCGHRMFERASVCGNEDLIGEVLAGAISKGVVKREELFIASALWDDMCATQERNREIILLNESAAIHTILRLNSQILQKTI